MINESKLKEICNTYKIDYDKLVNKNENILKYGEYYNICYALNFLRDELNIEPRNIEKCPSILYLNVENIKSNYEFLKNEQITKYSVEGCLHILSTEPTELKRTYQYIMENYGIRYLNAKTTILSVQVDRIKNIEIKFPELKKKSVLQAACSRRTIEEIEEILNVCKANRIEPTGSVFKRTAEEIEMIIEVCKVNGIEPTRSVFIKSAKEIEKIIEVCQANGVEPTGTVFLKSAEEVEKIIEVCKVNGIELTGSVFYKSAEEIEKIVKICKENKVKITGSIFQKSAKKLKENIDYIRENYGETYLKPLIITKNIKSLKLVLPYLQEKRVLEVLPKSASILSLTLDEIKEREKFIESIGESVLNTYETKFNSIFGLSRKKYAQRVEKEKNNQVEL